MEFGSAGSVTFAQGAIVVLLVAQMIVFALDRFRIELVALGGLVIGAALGVVPLSGIFSGLANPAVITVGEILLIVHALARSQVVDRIAGLLSGFARGEMAALALLCGIAAAISVFMNNVGALALTLPVAISMCGRLGIPLGRVLMPLSFATLLGGLCSLIGTPPNLIVSHARLSAVGRSFALFDFALVGVPTAIVGILFLAWAAPRLAASRWSEPAGKEGIGRRKLVTEARIPAASTLIGRNVAALAGDLGGKIFAVVRDDERVFGRPAAVEVREDDILVFETTAVRLEEMIVAGAVKSTGPAPVDGAVTVDAVVMPQSLFVGSRIGSLHLLATRGIEAIAVVPQRMRIEGRLADVQLSIGDVVVLRGPAEAMDQVLDEADLLRLSPRSARSRSRPTYAAVTAFAAGILVTSVGLLPPEVAFGLVVLALAAAGTLNLREGLQSLNWPILVMLAAMIPLGSAVEATGAAKVISHALLGGLPSVGPVVLVGCMLLIAVVVTPFVNNASTAIILSPIALEIARAAHLPPEPFLLAVAAGASLDFLTPFGHHNNTIVMGIAGYSFTDYPRLGGPLLILCFATVLGGLGLFWL